MRAVSPPSAPNAIVYFDLSSGVRVVSSLPWNHDEVLKRAFVRSVEVIGEATKKVPEETRSEFPALEWKKMAGMRDRFIHDYGGADYLIVWDVAANKAADLAAKLRPILEAVDPS